MHDLPYGVGKVIFGEEEEQPYVKLGDGTVRIFTQIWDKDNVGLKIAQLHESEEAEPFSRHEYNEENPPHKTDGNEIHILFDNVKSIDAMIGQLNFIKDVMEEK